MAFLDFIKNRQSQQQPSESAAKPETAKEMYTREAGQEKPAFKPNELSQSDKASLTKAQELYQQGTSQGKDSPQVPAPAPEGATSAQPMAQMSMNQDKAAPALSPTSAQTGTRTNEQESPSAPNESQTQSKAQEQAKTMARRPPSWER
jgi:hypothetical protein